MLFPSHALVAACFLSRAFSFVLPVLPLPALVHDGQQTPLRGVLKGESAPEKNKSELDVWLKKEEKLALDRLMANVAPGGRNVLHAAPGTVIASPSKEYPDYYFQWVRDAAITMSTVVDVYASDSTSYLSAHLLPILQAYASLQYDLQHNPNPSGTFDDLSSLGEPKFHVDGSPFTDNWGRPQRDGPALRAITLMSFLRAYNASHPSLWTSTEGQSFFHELYDASLPANSIIKADLEYVSRYWSAPSFDLWEEVSGTHFFTLMVQLRALREGAVLANAFNDPGAAAWYTSSAERISALLDRFHSPTHGHLVATLDAPSRSGLDCALLLGSLHGNAQEPTYPQSPRFSPYSDAVLLSLLALITDQRHRFPINSAPAGLSDSEAADPLRGVGIGRYPEDVYTGTGTADHGGNPWFLCTASVSELLYRVAAHLSQTNTLHVSGPAHPFWRALVCRSHSDAACPAGLTPKAGMVYEKGDPVFEAAVQRLREVGDGFLDVVKRHADGTGALSEQFDRWTGFERGAADLTWSYGALLQAVWARGRLD
ncbi:glycoside hydrolase family 15 protein [Saccharata proteae CBS 121410]|uniref:glucan 1,4-alpha-glucosidase n=1 Tax=Saccharata proteae CBS 121410 TaxID=1314787 RepID=A0A9P4HQU5_9PEZI|nr:glycoside hydrolase family 15 protein [Saccharata proteae CBS 121410]